MATTSGMSGLTPDVEAATARNVAALRNGSAPRARAKSPRGPRTFPPGRRCETCGEQLSTTQRRWCSSACRRPGGNHVVAPVEASVPVGPGESPVPTSLVAVLEQLPVEVLAVELNGWRCVRT